MIFFCTQYTLYSKHLPLEEILQLDTGMLQISMAVQTRRREQQYVPCTAHFSSNLIVGLDGSPSREDYQGFMTCR